MAPLTQTAATAILAKIDPATAPRLSYAYEQWLFHYMADDDGLVFLAVADAAMGRRVPFAFLAEMQKAYRATPGAPGAFQAPLDALRRECHADPDADPIKRAQTELGSVKDVITRNVEPRRADRAADGPHRLGRQPKSRVPPPRGEPPSRNVVAQHAHTCPCRRVRAGPFAVPIPCSIFIVYSRSASG